MKTSALARVPSVPRISLQRKCACGRETHGQQKCPACALKRQALQRRIGDVDDPLETEADRVADRVIAGGSSGTPDAAPVHVQRRAHRASETAATPPASVDRALAGSSSRLDAALRGDMESRFRSDFSQVRVHTGATAEQSAEDIDAAAYTVGHHIVFGRGRFAPSTLDGRRLIAHELTHVLQQTGSSGAGAERSAAGATSTPVVQRKPDPPKKATAADAPKMIAQDAKNPPPCACLVFMHHNEPNARLTAQTLYEYCHYNLAIVQPTTGERDIDLPGTGAIDPNELFPREVAEECWNDDKPCTDFIADNAGKSKAADVKKVAERQFFLAIKKCSNKFTLPVVGLHNNTIDDTASYRKSLAKTSGGPDLTKIRGKVFDDQLKPGDKAPANTLPYKELHDWLKKLGGVEDDKKNAGKKNDLTGGPMQKGKTNIFLWCAAADNSKCQIGDPEHPDNVVWVTNPADFEKLRGTKTNVALQTSVDPKGNSSTDLSSLFVFLADIMGKHFDSIEAKFTADTADDLKAIAQALDRLLFQAPKGADPEIERMLDIARILLHTLRMQMTVEASTKLDAERKQRSAQLRFTNIETPQSTDEAGVSKADFRVTSLHNVKATLATLGVDCCDTKAAAGQTESATDKVEKAVRAGKLPEAPGGKK